MAKRGRPKKDKDLTIKSKETQIFIGLVLVVLGVSFIINNSLDNTLSKTINQFFGQTTYLVGLILGVIGFRLIDLDLFITKKRFLYGLIIGLLAIMPLLQAIIATTGQTNNYINGGGQIGLLMHNWFYSLMGPAAEIGLLIVILIVAISLLSGISLGQFSDSFKKIIQAGQDLILKITKREKNKSASEDEPDIIDSSKIGLDDKEDLEDLANLKLEELDNPKSKREKGIDENKIAKEDPKQISVKFGKTLHNKENSDQKKYKPRFPHWNFPPLDLLTPSEPDQSDESSIRENGRAIEQTLANFNIQAKVTKIYKGPRVIQYGINLASGTRASKVKNLAKDLSLALAAESDSIRIDSIEGTSLIGVEVPRKDPASVRLHEIIKGTNIEDQKIKLPLYIGKDIIGNLIVKDLTTMPHLLIAGATGTGKSVSMNSIIVGMLMKYSPDDLKFILVDPKMVELSLYNSIPHLLTPVITEKDKVINSLEWALAEMHNRYTLFKEKRVRNITEYNELGLNRMPYIIVAVDEMADLILTARNEIEQKIVRLAQLARATGIHLILATQRPSVNVITGLIKANVPARLALGVTSSVDSRVIIDQVGAETLLGKGDLLMKTPTSVKIKRIQGAFVSNKEIQKVTDFIRKQTKLSDNEIYDEAVISPQTEQRGGQAGEGGVNISDDPLFNEAVEVVINAGKASSSYLQRQLNIGFNRAARLIDQMEEAGIVGAAKGQKPREVLISNIDELTMNR